MQLPIPITLPPQLQRCGDDDSSSDAILFSLCAIFSPFFLQSAFFGRELMLLLLLLLSVLLSLLLAYYNANSYCARYPFVYRRATELTLFCRCVMSPGGCQWVGAVGRWTGGVTGHRRGRDRGQDLGKGNTRRWQRRRTAKVSKVMDDRLICGDIFMLMLIKFFVLHAGTAASAAIMGFGSGWWGGCLVVGVGVIFGWEDTTTGSRPCRRSCSVTF